MQTPRLLAVLSGALVGIACSDNTSSPTSFIAHLNVAQEVPAPTGTSSLAGTATVTPSGGGSSGTITYTLALTGTATSAITASHIHTGAAGSTGPVRVNLCGAGTAPACPATGSSVNGSVTFSATPNNVLGSPVLTFDGLTAALRGYTTYVNVHTTNNPGGEARGELLFGS
jgi:hypothetical protein